MEKKNIFEIIESYYAAHLLIQLNSRGLFKDPEKKRRISDWFQDTGVYQFLKTSTDIIQSDDEQFFSINPKYGSYTDLSFYIEKFLEAYGQFNHTGKGPLIAIDEKKFAKAFLNASSFQNPVTAMNIFSALKAQTILDLGCGTGNLLIQFCKKNKLNRAYGIDQNPHLYLAAQKQIKEKKLAKKAKIIKGSVSGFDKLLSSTELGSIDVIYGASILNEFFNSPDGLVKFLKKLRKFFPDKYFIVVDYYGILNTSKVRNKKLRHNYVHDVMQLLSGQGLPAKDQKAWNEYYRKAACELVHVHEHRDGDIHWFIHVLRLNGQKKWNIG